MIYIRRARQGDTPGALPAGGNILFAAVAEEAINEVSGSEGGTGGPEKKPRRAVRFLHERMPPDHPGYDLIREYELQTWADWGWPLDGAFARGAKASEYMAGALKTLERGFKVLIFYPGANATSERCLALEKYKEAALRIVRETLTAKSAVLGDRISDAAIREFSSKAQIVFDAAKRKLVDSVGQRDHNPVAGSASASVGTGSSPALSRRKSQPSSDPRYQKIDPALRSIADARPANHEEVFRVLTQRKIPCPDAEPFRSAGGWMKAFENKPERSRQWLSTRWFKLGLRPFRKGRNSCSNYSE